MTRRAWLVLGIALALGGVAAFGVAERTDGPLPERPAEQRPTLTLLTSLPLMFGESFGLDGGGSPALTRLEQRYKVMPIGVADAASLKGQRLLLMAHPRAQPAEALVELDQWVRGGGRVLLLADPRLDWPSQRPLGDPLRPAPMFADTGLLDHWGLSLMPPRPVNPGASGKLSRKGRSSCRIENAGKVARCRIERGRATVIADADFINAADPDASGLDLLVAELARLESR